MQFVCQTDNGTNRIRLDISDVELANKEKLEPYLVFTGSTFKTIKEADTDPDAFLHIFQAPNWALSHIDNAKKIVVAQYFASVNYTIRNSLPKDPGQFVPFVEKLGDAYLAMTDAAGLLDVFREYSATKITLQDTHEFGSRPQDTEELTFSPDHMREVMVIAMFCKLAAPIFGELINNIPEEIDYETGKKKLPRYKESKCSSFMTACLSKYFPEMLNKLHDYVQHIVDGQCAKNPDPVVVFHGLTPSTRTNLIMSSLFVRNYVLCQLEKAESNIMRYTDTMVRTLTQTQNTNANKCQVRTRKAPGSMMSGDESGNMAQMEVDSLVSVGTMDGPIIIEDSIDRIIQKYRLVYQITLSEWNGCLDFFKENPVTPSILNKFLATIVFGREIGGGRGIEFVGEESLTKLVAMLQLIAISLGLPALAMMLTANKSNNVRITLNAEQDTFRRMASTLPKYRDRRASFVAGDNEELSLDLRKNSREQVWDEQMKELLSDLAYTIYSVNTPDCILDQVPEGSEHCLGDYYHNGDIIEPTTDITEGMCTMMEIFSSDND